MGCGSVGFFSFDRRFRNGPCSFLQPHLSTCVVLVSSDMTSLDCSQVSLHHQPQGHAVAGQVADAREPVWNPARNLLSRKGVQSFRPGYRDLSVFWQPRRKNRYSRNQPHKPGALAQKKEAARLPAVSIGPRTNPTLLTRRA